jgi:hypothetical protein
MTKAEKLFFSPDAFEWMSVRLLIQKLAGITVALHPVIIFRIMNLRAIA